MYNLKFLTLNFYCLGKMLLAAYLFPLSLQYAQRGYYTPWVEVQNNRWTRVPQKRQITAYQFNNPESERHFAPDTITKITETLGALNTVGRYLVNMTRGTNDNAPLSDEVPSAIYTISKNVLGRNVTDTIAPLVREALPSVIEDKSDESLKEDEEDDVDSRSCTTPEGLKG